MFIDELICISNEPLGRFITSKLNNSIIEIVIMYVF